MSMETQVTELGETETGPTQKETVSEDEKAAPAKAEPGGREIARDFAKGFVVTLLALALKVGFEQTSLGEQFQTTAYNYLQMRLETPGLDETVPVAVVDISQLQPVQVYSEGWQRSITPRKELQELIEAIASPRQVKAIGVDIDFAPDDPGFMGDDDDAFFQKCLEITETTGVPIFLGIRRSQDLAPEAWLGDPEYRSLAATVSVRKLDGRRLPIWTKRDGDAEAGPSLSGALAAELPESGSRPPWWIRWGSRHVSEARLAEHNLVFAEFLVDYGFLDLIRHKTLKTINPVVIADQLPLVLRNKVVLLGDAIPGGSDTSAVPGQTEPVPGVYLHACAVYTLTNPLYEMTSWGRTVVDLALSTLLIGIVAAIRFRARSSELDLSVLQGVLTLLIILLAFVVGIVFVRETRIMWDDFILAIGVLCLHPSIEKWWHLAKTKILPFVKTFFKK